MMGTDVYLQWDGMSKEEIDARDDAVLTNHGEVGCLRASIFMGAENAFLRQMFPIAWESGEQVLSKEDFDELYEAVQQLSEKYMEGELCVPDDKIKQLRELIAERSGESLPPERTVVDRLDWLKEFLEFYKKAWKLAIEGRRVIVFILR